VNGIINQVVTAYTNTLTGRPASTSSNTLVETAGKNMNADTSGISTSAGSSAGATSSGNGYQQVVQAMVGRFANTAGSSSNGGIGAGALAQAFADGFAQG